MISAADRDSDVFVGLGRGSAENGAIVLRRARVCVLLANPTIWQSWRGDIAKAHVHGQAEKTEA